MFLNLEDLATSRNNFFRFFILKHGFSLNFFVPPEKGKLFLVTRDIPTPKSTTIFFYRLMINLYNKLGVVFRFNLHKLIYYFKIRKIKYYKTSFKNRNFIK